MARIALAQTTSRDEVAENLAVARSLVDQAVSCGADLLAFPEVFLYLGGRRKKLQIAEPLDGPLVSEFQELAARHGLMILLGSLHECIDGDLERVYNTSVLVGADGQQLAVYRKIKLFDVDLPHLRLKESDTIVPGEERPPVVDTPIGKLGLTICFDLRFSPLYLDLRERGAEVVFVPSNFTAPTGQAHWEVLLRARAVEHQVYVAAPAQVGEHNPKYTSHGHSMLVDPWGKVLVCKATGTGLCYADVDLEYLRKVRAELPMKVAEGRDSALDREGAKETSAPSSEVVTAVDL